MEITAYTIPQLESLLLKWISEVEETGNRWAEAKAEHETVDDKRKPMLAAIKCRHEGSEAKKTTLAEASKEYKIFLMGLSEARKSYLQAQVNYDTAKLKVDALRTLISARKVEVANFKG